ncbi:TadE family type IV pilus minor pilin [Kitasatospora sp. NPDC052896]|uniref:TadE family type IV pilus minor pilin n=1 Tax=Kitasatospora sp. NPDC052896 TaxID=3364061 RepID=UPI0037CADCC9
MHGGRDGGYVTAETAVALPALVLLLAMVLWGGAAAAAKLRCLDAARVGARAAARGDGDAVAVATRAAPPGAVVRLTRQAGVVRVVVEAECLGPGRLASALSVTVAGDAVAALEDSTGGEV